MNALVPINAQPSFSVNDVEKVAHAIAKGGLFGSKDPYAVLTLCLLAQAEGQHPAVVFRDYHIISGKPAKKAEAMLRDFINAGGKIEWHQLDDTIADATFSHQAGGTARISWDHKRAVQAQIAGNAMYKKYPRQMLRSRVISEGVRTIYPGATSGLYVEEEVRAFDSVGGDVQGATVEHQPEPELQAEPSEKVAGIHKIKERLRLFRTAGDEAPDLETFNALVKANADDLTKIKDAKHEWWTGDGADFEGYRDWIVRRRIEFDGDNMVSRMIADMKETDTPGAFSRWLGANNELIEALDGADARRFQLACDLHESGLKAVATVTAG